MIHNPIPGAPVGEGGATMSTPPFGGELVSILAAAVYTCDTEGRLTYFNAAAAELWGREPQLGRDLWCGSWRIYHADGTEMSLDECPMAVTLREGRAVRGREIIIERPDGSRRHIQPHPEPMWATTAKGRTLVGAVNMLVDITRHKRLERALRESRERQKQIIELLPAAVYTCDAETGELTFYNERAAELWGRWPRLGEAAERFCGSHRLFLPDGRAMAHDETPMADAIRHGRVTRNQEVDVERPDGSRVTVLVNIDPIRDESGKIVGAINVFHDTTEWKQAEKDRAHLAAVVENSNDAIISKTLQGVIASWNQGAERMFGYTAEEAIGQPISMLIPPDRQHEEAEILSRLHRGEKVDTFTETVRLRKDGTVIDVALTISPICDSSGRVIGASKIARDITERKRIEKELANYQEHLQELVELRTRELAQTQQKLVQSERTLSLGTLAAGLGHDIGNLMMPMAVHLKAVQDAMQGAAGDMDLAERVGAIMKSFDYLRKLASGLRMMAIDPDASSSEQWRPTDLGQWWQETYPLLKTALTGRFRLDCEIAPDVPQVAIPRHLLTQAVFNIVQNAGYAMAGQADGHVGIIMTADDARENVRLSVIDNGPGMDEDVKRRCVEPFFTTRSRGISTGLGLALVQGIVQEAGGRLEIESVLGSGCTFTLVLPSAQSRDHRSGDELPVATVDIEDARLRALLRHVLNQVHFDIAETGGAARLFGKRPHLLVVDHRPEAQAAAGSVLEHNASARMLVLTDDDSSVIRQQSDRVTTLSPATPAATLRERLRALTDEHSDTRSDRSTRLK